MRREVWLVVLIAAVVVAGGISAWSLGGSDGGPPPASTRSADSSLCPKLALKPVAGVTPVDRQLRNLGGGLMGESRTYRTARATFELHVGYEALEAYEDLDFQPHGTLAAGGFEFKLSRAEALTAPFWAATSELERGPERCRDVTAIGKRLEERPFRALLGEITPA